jgi:hypothetical protein
MRDSFMDRYSQYPDICTCTYVLKRYRLITYPHNSAFTSISISFLLFFFLFFFLLLFPHYKTDFIQTLDAHVSVLAASPVLLMLFPAFAFGLGPIDNFIPVSVA